MRMPIFLFSFMIGILTVSTGCATFHPEPISPSETASAFEARALDDPGLKAFLEANLHHELTPWPPASWDFTLLTLAAFYYHPDMDLARARWGTAEAGVLTAGGRPNPGIGVAPQFNADAVSGISPWTLGFNLDIPIETAGKRGYRIAQAKHLSEAGRLNIVTAAWQIRSRLRSSLLNLYTANQTEPILKRQLEIQEEIVRLLEERLTVGEVSQPDLTQAHIALDQTRLLLLEARKQAAEARVQLADSLGLPVSALDRPSEHGEREGEAPSGSAGGGGDASPYKIDGVEISLDLLNRLPTEMPSQDVRRQTLVGRSDILSALAEYAAAQSVLQLEIAKQYPDIHLGPGYAWDQGDNKWSLGFSISLPVFNRNEGPIAEAEAHRTETAARFTAFQARVIGEMDRALAGARAARKKLETAEALLSDRKDQYETARAMFEIGETDRLALLSAQLELEATALSRADALVEAQQSLGLLEDAMQRPLHPSESFPVIPEADPRAKEENNP